MPTATAGHAVLSSWGGRRVVAEVVAEALVVSPEVAVEPHAPRARAGKADSIVFMGEVGQINHDDDAIARPALLGQQQRACLANSRGRSGHQRHFVLKSCALHSAVPKAFLFIVLFLPDPHLQGLMCSLHQILEAFYDTANFRR